MFLIAGLGNPGQLYKGTRHNVGFEVINKLAFDHNITVNSHKKRAVVGNGILCGQKAIFAMPLTFMNKSGESIRDLIDYYKIIPQNLIVVYDDTAIETGSIRIRKQGSAGGHNGMKDIIYQLETDEFPRVRVGISEKPSGWDLSDYVLSRFRENECDDIISGITQAALAVETIVAEGVDNAMNKFNRRQESKQ